MKCWFARRFGAAVGPFSTLHQAKEGDDPRCVMSMDSARVILGILVIPTSQSIQKVSVKLLSFREEDER